MDHFFDEACFQQLGDFLCYGATFFFRGIFLLRSASLLVLLAWSQELSAGHAR
jgi:hypothetical protein